MCVIKAPLGTEIGAFIICRCRKSPFSETVGSAGNRLLLCRYFCFAVVVNTNRLLSNNTSFVNLVTHFCLNTCKEREMRSTAGGLYFGVGPH